MILHNSNNGRFFNQFCFWAPFGYMAGILVLHQQELIYAAQDLSGWQPGMESFAIACQSMFGLLEWLALPQTPLQLEVFPTWSPDGQWLYYGMARVPFDDHLDTGTQKELMSRFIESDEFAQSYIISQYDRIFYDIYRRPFDAATCSLGEPECVVEASQAFMMPQADPEHELYSTLSYNVPELTLEAVSLSPDEVSEALR